MDQSMAEDAPLADSTHQQACDRQQFKRKIQMIESAHPIIETVHQLTSLLATLLTSPQLFFTNPVTLHQIIPLALTLHSLRQTFTPDLHARPSRLNAHARASCAARPSHPTFTTHLRASALTLLSHARPNFHTRPSHRTSTPQRSRPTFAPQPSRPTLTPQPSHLNFTPQTSHPPFTSDLHARPSHPTFMPQPSHPIFTPRLSRSFQEAAIRCKRSQMKQPSDETTFE